VREVRWRQGCKQFPIRVCFAMIVNKSHGQSLRRVGIYLNPDAFSHNQLYVSLSRTTDLNKLLLADDGAGEDADGRGLCHGRFKTFSMMLFCSFGCKLNYYVRNTSAAHHLPLSPLGVRLLNAGTTESGIRKSRRRSRCKYWRFTVETITSLCRLPKHANILSLSPSAILYISLALKKPRH